MTATVDAALMALANRLADRAGGIIRRYFRQKIAIDDKEDSSPVTLADREVESELRQIIENECPAHGIIGEEHGALRADAEYVWVIDPIDGTKSFISGIPIFGTLIALTRKGVPILGVIDQPISRERWLGALGHPTTLNGTPIHTRSCAGLASASLYATTPDMFQGGDAAGFAKLSGAVKRRCFGADCYAYGLLALGCIDLVAEASMKIYDYLAMVPIVEGAGGIITDWEGRKLTLESGSRVIACGDKSLSGPARALLTESI